MRNAYAFQPEASPADGMGHDRRTPEFSEHLEPPPRQANASLCWPVSWPAALYAGEAGAACKVQFFSAMGAQITLRNPPRAGTMVSLKFPFTIYLKGRVAWSRGDDLGIDFDEDTRRSARIVEEVLLDNTGIRYASLD